RGADQSAWTGRDWTVPTSFDARDGDRERSMKGLIFTYLLTATGVLGGFFYPYLGLLVYVCLSIVQPPSMWPWAVTPESFSRFVALSLRGGWARGGLGNWGFGRAGPIVAMLLGYWAWMAGSAALAGNQKLAW